MKKILKILSIVWFCVAGLIIVACYVLEIINKGFNEFFAMLNPFNIWNTIAVIAALSPGILLNYLSGKIKEKEKKNEKPKDLENINVSIDDILSDYGDSLQKYTNTYVPITYLPYPKDLIKKAIITKLETETNQNLINALEVAYVSLSKYIDDNIAIKYMDNENKILYAAKSISIKDMRHFIMEMEIEIPEVNDDSRKLLKEVKELRELKKKTF